MLLHACCTVEQCANSRRRSLPAHRSGRWRHSAGSFHPRRWSAPAPAERGKQGGWGGTRGWEGGGGAAAAGCKRRLAAGPCLQVCIGSLDGQLQAAELGCDESERGGAVPRRRENAGHPSQQRRMVQPPASFDANTPRQQIMMDARCTELLGRPCRRGSDEPAVQHVQTRQGVPSSHALWSPQHPQ